MKTATIRQVQHNLAEILRQVEAGEEFKIVRRNHPVARLIPIKDVFMEDAGDYSLKYTNKIGCRTLDILHVAAARIMNAEEFVTNDDSQRFQHSGENIELLLDFG